MAARRARMLVGFWAVLTFAVAIAPPAAASRAGAVIQVFPGRHALRDALASASAGDTLNLHTGTYRDAVTIGLDGLTLRAAGDGPVTVDGRCRTGAVLTIRADGVTIRGLHVVGANEGFSAFPSEVDLTGVNSGGVYDSFLEDTCNAEYGVNVFSSGTVIVGGNTATGFSDSGIYIGAITSTPLGALIVRHNEVYGSSRGIIVEDSSGGSIRVVSNNLHDNAGDGVFLHNSDGVALIGNTLTGNAASGIHLDPGSDSNKVTDNALSSNSPDLWNEGSNNCFRRNVYSTSSGPIAC